MKEPTPREKCDALVETIAASGTPESAAALRKSWEHLKDVVDDGQLKVLLTIEQQKVYAEDRAEAEDDD